MSVGDILRAMLKTGPPTPAVNPPRPRETHLAPLPLPAPTFADTDELTLLACAVFGEARGEEWRGKLAVAWTIKNRTRKARRFGTGYHGVLLKPWQFSCFNPDDPNRAKLLRPLDFGDSSTWSECYRAACAAFFGFESDPTEGADHYHTTGVAPPWSRDARAVARIGTHVFFRLG